VKVYHNVSALSNAIILQSCKSQTCWPSSYPIEVPIIIFPQKASKNRYEIFAAEARTPKTVIFYSQLEHPLGLTVTVIVILATLTNFVPIGCREMRMVMQCIQIQIYSLNGFFLK